jgi:hypothetical protein
MKFKKYLKEEPKGLADEIYNTLIKVKEFKKLSMDRQGEIIVKIMEMMK